VQLALAGWGRLKKRLKRLLGDSHSSCSRKRRPHSQPCC
jgi:hypothetical protein